MSRKRNKRGAGEGSLIQDGGVWYFRHPAIGRRSLSTRDRADAERAVRERYGDLILAYQLGQDTDRIVQRHQAARETIAAAMQVEAARKVPLAACWQRYLDALPALRGGSRHVDATQELPRAPGTLANYRHQWDRFVAGMAAAGIEHAEDLTRDAVVNYFADMRRGGATAGTYNRHLSGCRVVLYGATGDKAALTFVGRQGSQVEAVTRRPLTAAEVATVRAAATGWQRAAIDVGLATSLRLGDVLTLRWEDVDWEGYIFDQARKTSKGQGYYCPEAIPALRQWQQEGKGAPKGYVFPDQAHKYLGGDGRPPDRTVASREFSVWLREVLAGAPEPERLGFSSLRKTAATVRAAKTGDRQAAATLLGHSSQAVTNRHYISPDRDQAKMLAMAQANPMANITDAELLAECRRRGLSWSPAHPSVLPGLERP